jgi:hypothetical protein
VFVCLCVKVLYVVAKEDWLDKHFFRWM